MGQINSRLPMMNRTFTNGSRSSDSSDATIKPSFLKDSFGYVKAATKPKALLGPAPATSAKAAVGKFLLAGLGVAAIIGATVAVTKYSSQILSAVSGLGAHGGIVAGVLVGVTLLITGIVATIVLVKKQKQANAWQAAAIVLNEDKEALIDRKNVLKSANAGLEKEVADAKNGQAREAAVNENQAAVVERLNCTISQMTSASSSPTFVNSPQYAQPKAPVISQETTYHNVEEELLATTPRAPSEPTLFQA